MFSSFDRDGLQRAFGPDYMRGLIDGGFVAADPEAAYDRLRSADGAAPLRSGAGSAAIEALRAVIAEVAPGAFAGQALMITAPHTHWAPAPIIVTWSQSESRYWIGPGRQFRRVRPVSFVFTPAGATPYEWAEANLLETATELEKAYEIVRLTAARLIDAGCPLPAPVGLSVNHRFKRIGEPAFCSTMEIPDSESGLSFVVPDRFGGLALEAFGGQVGWPIAEPPVLTEAEAAAMAKLDEIFGGLAPREAGRLFAELRRIAAAGEARAG